MKERGNLCYINVVFFPWGQFGYKKGKLPLYSKLSVGEKRLYSQLFGRGWGYVAIDPREKMARWKRHYILYIKLVYLTAE